MIVLCLLAVSTVASCDTRKDDEEYFQKFFVPNLVPAFAKKIVDHYYIDLKGPDNPIVAGRFMHNLDDLSMRAMMVKATVGDKQSYSSPVVKLAMRLMAEHHTDAKLIKAGYHVYGDMLLRSIREAGRSVQVFEENETGATTQHNISDHEVGLMMKALAQDLRTRATTLRSVLRLYATHPDKKHSAFYERDRIAQTDNCHFREENGCFGGAQQIRDHFDVAFTSYFDKNFSIDEHVVIDMEDVLWGMRRMEGRDGENILETFIHIFENAAHSIDSNTYRK